MRIFADQICKREPSEKAVMIAAYGIYLMNGGTKEGFMDLTLDDIQTIYTTYTAYQTALVSDITKVLSKMYGGE